MFNTSSPSTGAERPSTHRPTCLFSCPYLWERARLPGFPSIVPKPQLETLILLLRPFALLSTRPVCYRGCGCLPLYTGGHVDNYHCWAPGYREEGWAQLKTVHGSCLTSSDNKSPLCGCREAPSGGPRQEAVSSPFPVSRFLEATCIPWLVVTSLPASQAATQNSFRSF